jgi:hypothetical protein
MTASSYQRKLAADNAANLNRSRADRDIADGFDAEALTADELAERAACERDFRRFCETYFPAAFCLPWSDDHLRAIERIESAVLDGGLFALAMPRGSGKTTLCERAALWALLYGHRRFVCLLGSTEKRAGDLLDHLKTELLLNEHLRRPFRAVCYPIRRLENNARKAIGQLFEGKQTRVAWSADRLTLPTMPDAACDGVNVSGSTVTVAGLTGALRGQSHTLASGEVIRPELVLLDDPQTRESAMSPSQCAERLAIVAGDVLGMTGPGRKVAALMPCTVIREGDLADTLLNRETNPAWQGERTAAVYAWPSDGKLWERYHQLRAEGLRAGKGTAAATDFYAEHREAMDKGANVAWPARHNDDELSAVQHVMNLRADLGEHAFAAEYQNVPLKTEADDLPTLTAEQVARKLNGVKRRIVPTSAEHVTAFIDVHDALLFWTVAAWSADFAGYVIDYGTWPEQSRGGFTLRNARRTLASVAPGAGREGAIRAGLDTLTADLLGREYTRDDRVPMRIARCLVDAGYAADVVHDFCRHSVHAAVLMPSRGVGIRAANKPMSEYNRHTGDRFGWNWYCPAPSRGRTGRYVRFDSNHWKRFVHDRLAAALGDTGCLSLWGRDATAHRMFAEHVTAEAPTRVSANGRTVDEWRMRPGVTDNHWLDCVVGCAVAGSMLGVALPGVGAQPDGPRRPPMRLSEQQRRAREQRQKAR